MNITLLMVTSINGKITSSNDADISKWTSKEDFDHFSSMIAKANLIVMGSSTYEAAQEKMVLSAEKLRIVLTRNPKKYEAKVVPGQLEFSDEVPEQLIKRLEQESYKEMLLVGGGQINAVFFKEGLVSEMYLTLEPKLFGEGKPLLSEVNVDVNAKLESSTRLNEQGTLLLHYIIHKNGKNSDENLY